MNRADSPCVSVIIPTLNEERYLPALLESLACSDATLDVIVVDGYSQDGTVAAAERFSSRFSGRSSLRVLHSSVRNISAQRNQGAEEARYPLLVFADADVVFPAGSMRKLVAYFKKSRALAAAPRLAPIEPGIRYKASYAFALLIQRLLLMAGRAYFAGICIITTREAFEQAGRFDPEVTLAEDIDFTNRVAALGRCVILPVTIRVSARRLIKYGYSWLTDNPAAFLQLLATGRIDPNKVRYPFGEF